MMSSISTGRYRRMAFASLPLLLFFLAGCGPDAEALALPEVNVEVPSEFSQDGTTWVREEVESDDQNCLARFFQRNQELVGSPDIEGDPVLFTSGKHDRRFYWVNATADGSRWTCVQFRKSRYSTLDGNGSPF